MKKSHFALTCKGVRRLLAVFIAASTLAACSGGNTSSVLPNNAYPQSAQSRKPEGLQSPSVAGPERATMMWRGAPTRPVMTSKIHYDYSPSYLASHRSSMIAYATTSGGNLIYHGGYIQHAANLLVVTWGFSPNDTTRDPWGAANRILSLAQSAADTANGSWMYTLTQYDGLTGSPPFTTDATGPGYVAEWSDTSSYPPANYTNADVQNEVIRASNAVAPGSNPYGNGWEYLILTPSGVVANGFLSQWCGIHSAVGYTPYAILPYAAGTSCGDSNAVNPGSIGMLDGATIIAGHELAEMLTDPFPGGTGPGVPSAAGWSDANGYEIGDKCDWAQPGIRLGDVTFPNGQTFAMQPLWSNASSSCVMSTYVPPVPPPPTPGPGTPSPRPTIPPCWRNHSCGPRLP